MKRSGRGIWALCGVILLSACGEGSAAAPPTEQQPHVVIEFAILSVRSVPGTPYGGLLAPQESEKEPRRVGVSFGQALSAADWVRLQRRAETLRSQGRCETLTCPTIIASENQSAQIAVGQLVSARFGGNACKALKDEDHVGLVADVVPTLQPDGTVHLAMDVEKTDAVPGGICSQKRKISFTVQPNQGYVFSVTKPASGSIAPNSTVKDEDSEVVVTCRIRLERPSDQP